MIVIHIDNGTTDSAILSTIYEGLENVVVYHNVNKREAKKILKSSVDDTLMLLGHGTQHGLLNADMNGFAVGSEHAELLRNRPVIGIFCYAADFGDRYGLHGFFTSMFISNMTEAIYEQKDANADDETIAYQTKLFCDRIHMLIESKTPLDKWVDILQSQADLSLPFVKFNYEALTYL